MLLALQTENAQLKARQAAAKVRLKALLAKIQAIPANPHESQAA
jgi:FtsZ-binding cell division protein ZapB